MCASIFSTTVNLHHGNLTYVMWACCLCVCIYLNVLRCFVGHSAFRPTQENTSKHKRPPFCDCSFTLAEENTNRRSAAAQDYKTTLIIIVKTSASVKPENLCYVSLIRRTRMVDNFSRFFRNVSAAVLCVLLSHSQPI